MAIKRDEIADPNSCLNRATDEEPIFVLRGKDPLFAKIVEEWAARALLAGLHDDKVRAAFRFAQFARGWRKEHFPQDVPEPVIEVKFPDLEKQR
ncbi:MAG TPA: hypothetical protein VE008_07130 [Burkholderiales bacterium]|nr:hypothetical protein [Burkholderiales bacterium]